VENMEFAARFLVPNHIRISSLFMGKFHCGFNGTLFAGSWPTKIAAALGATRLISDDVSIEHFSVASPAFEGGRDPYEMSIEKYPCLSDLPDAGIINKICPLEEGYTLHRLGCRRA